MPSFPGCAVRKNDSARACGLDLLLGWQRAFMGPWLTATETKYRYGHGGINGDREPAPGESGGSAREVSGGVSGGNKSAAPGASVSAHRLAFAGLSRRRSFRTGPRAGAPDRAGCRLKN